MIVCLLWIPAVVNAVTFDGAPDFKLDPLGRGRGLVSLVNLKSATKAGL